MGRRPNAPTQRADGYWYARHPGLKRIIRLGATSFTEAVAEQQSFYGVVDEPVYEDSTVSSNPVPPSGSGGGDSVLNLDEEIGSEPTPPKKAESAADLLTSWGKSSASMAGSTSPISPPAPQAVNPASPAIPVHSKPVAPRIQKGLTPEQSAKIASGLKKMVVNTNVVVMAAAVQMFGRVPAPLDNDEIALLQMGWEMYLDELFLKAKLKPIHLVIVGNLMIAVSMWASGQPTKKPDPTATSKAAPGHGATVTQLQPPKG